MFNEDNFSISTEKLSENGQKLDKEVKIIQAALNDIDEARKSLNGWVSANKGLYESRVGAVIPKMHEMIEAINSYGKVAINTSQKAEEVEKRIADSIGFSSISASDE